MGRRAALHPASLQCTPRCHSLVHSHVHSCKFAVNVFQHATASGGDARCVPAVECAVFKPAYCWAALHQASFQCIPRCHSPAAQPYATLVLLICHECIQHAASSGGDAGCVPVAACAVFRPAHCRRAALTHTTFLQLIPRGVTAQCTTICSLAILSCRCISAEHGAHDTGDAGHVPAVACTVFRPAHWADGQLCTQPQLQCTPRCHSPVHTPCAHSCKLSLNEFKHAAASGGDHSEQTRFPKRPQKYSGHETHYKTVYSRSAPGTNLGAHKRFWSRGQSSTQFYFRGPKQI